MGCVDITTGTTMFFATDFRLPGYLTLEFERVYQSAVTREGPLGYGWSHNLDLRLIIGSEGISFQDEEARLVQFDLIAAGDASYNPQDGLTLERVGREFSVLTPDRIKYVFASLSPRLPNTLLLNRIEDLNGNALTFEYADGLIAIVTDSVNRRLLFKHDLYGRLTDIILSAAHAAEQNLRLVGYRYNEHGDLVTVLDALDKPYTFEYENHLMIKNTNRNGKSFYFQYDNQNRCIRTWKDRGVKLTQIRYDDKTNKRLVIDSLGNSTVYQIGDNSLVAKETDPLGAETTYLYDANDDLLIATDDEGLLTESAIQYDHQKNPILEVDPAGNSTFYSHNELNQLTELKDAEGNVWQWSYDERGNAVKALTPRGAEWLFEYDHHGYLTTMIEPTGAVVNLAHDPELHTETITDEFGVIVKVEFDRLGRLASTTDGLGNRQLVVHDPVGNLTEVKNPDGSVQQWDHDHEGNAARYHTKMGVDLSCDFDGWSLCTARKYPQNRTVTYEYDSEEEVVTVINQNGESHSFIADPRGDVLEQRFFDGRTERYEYNSRGDITGIVNNQGLRLELSYDENSNLVRKSFPDGAELLIEYDQVGRVIAAQYGGNLVQYEYDGHSNVLKETQNEQVLEYEYDLADNRTAMRLNGNLLCRYRYDSRDRLIALEDAGGRLHTFHYDALDRLILHVFPNGLTKVFTYNDSALTRHEQILTLDGKIMIDRLWQLDPEGNIRELLIDRTDRLNFTYDELEQITTVKKNDAKVAEFKYDPAGNLTSVNARDFQYGPGNRLVHADGVDYEYDLEGNITLQHAAGLTTHYDYDAKGQLIRILHPSGETTEYGYDPLGRRLYKLHAGVETRYVWDDTVIVAEIVNGEVTMVYLFEPDTFFPIEMLQAERAYFFDTNHLAAPLHLVNEQGIVVWKADYEVYGKVTISAAPEVRNPFRLAGQYHDEESGLYYNFYRYYDASIGRYISFDPSGIDAGLNGYQYTLNPLTWVDPWGLKGKIVTLPPYMERARNRGVARAWSAERQRLLDGKPSSRDWTKTEQNIIKKGKRPPGWEGHHKKSVKHHYAKCKKLKGKCNKSREAKRQCFKEAKRLAEAPGNIQFLQNGQARAGRKGLKEINEHLDAHGGHFCKATHGRYDV